MWLSAKYSISNELPYCHNILLFNNMKISFINMLSMIVRCLFPIGPVNV